jgi:short-chain fatty acids transporter
MISRLGSLCAKIFYHTCPDPFVIVILLTLVTALLAGLFGVFPNDASPTAVVFDAWRDGSTGIWKLLAFSMQMCLILVTGHALASAPLVRRTIDRLAARPKSAAQATGLVAAAACWTSIVNWGLGLIVGAILAREVGLACHRKGVRVHYPLLAAAGYVGLMVWHGGLSGSAPLSVTSPIEAAKTLPPEAVKLLGPDGVPLSRTLGSLLNLVTTGGLLIGVPLVLVRMTPRHSAEIRTVEDIADSARMLTERPAGDDAEQAGSIPDRLDRSWLVVALLALPLLAAVARFVWLRGAAAQDAGAVSVILHGLEGIGLNEINATMFALGLLLHGSARAYMAACEEGASGCAAIIIQFPLYAGIMAMMYASGLVKQIADLFVAFGNQTTIPFFSYMAACVVALFIPSGGGQWAIQGPIALAAGHAVGIDPGKMVMTVAYGDQVSNMLQPFWALPLLSITGVRARDVIGYTAAVMLIGGAWMGLCLLLF